LSGCLTVISYWFAYQEPFIEEEIFQMFESIITLLLMSILLIGAPGPAAMALVATGSSHNLHKGLPLIFGLVTGVLLTGLLTSIGMLTLLEKWPDARLIMQLVGMFFILMMAILMVKQPVEDVSEERSVQFGYVSGIVMNVLNPKAYATFMILISSFMPSITSKMVSIMVLEAVSLVATLIVTFSWLFLGGILGRIIRNPQGIHKMRIVFACLMVIFVIPTLFEVM
jgi:threonine/homoserine/homoserine lactone efflux protein